LAIKGGMAARVSAQLGDPEPALLVSKDAIVRRGDQVLVFRVMAMGPPTEPRGVGTRGMIEQVSVDIGPARGEWQVVYGAVAGGDLVVVRGNERVFPGQPVQVSAVRDLPVPMADLSKPIAVDPRQETGS
jgi:multidrug efflux pump subunit AcrA (membrane-fusion protein)